MTPATDAVFVRVRRHVLPLLTLCYFVAFIDRVNVGFAALSMNADLGFTPVTYSWGAGIFFLGYFVFEVPSNLILERVGARLWIARIMITWGIVSMAMAAVRGPISFFALRFLLGVAEAGFFPGMIFHVVISCALVTVALAVSSQLASPVAMMAVLCVAGIGIFANIPAFWTLPTSVTVGTAAAGGIALVNSIGNRSGFLAPYLIGVIKDSTGSFRIALGALAILPLAGMILTLWLRRLQPAPAGR
ncbi:MAG TPA: MFS transporter [Kofleriaceae bacterium]|jgi:MFS family permease|nr:MFS transporter [Kofleriaceae bacterium]